MQIKNRYVVFVSVFLLKNLFIAKEAKEKLDKQQICALSTSN